MRRLLPSTLVSCAVLLAGCGSGDDDTAATPTAATPTAATPTAGTTASTAPTSSASSGTSAPTATASGTGCRSGGGGVPAGAASAPTVDVDGDDRPDTVWIAPPDDAGAVTFGVTTASGGTSTADIASASPVARSVLVADVTGHGEPVALAGDGRQVLLYALSACELVPVRNAQGEQYAFDLGFTGYGTGVGCTDADLDGVRDLVGLRADGTSVTSTVVELDGPRATNGVSITVADVTPAEIELAHQVTCGDLTLSGDGVSTGP